jgi:uncharacterized damage-inducible protein DinB
MDAKTIKPLFEYNRWANARILDAAVKLSDEQYTRDLRSSHGSVRGTLVHIIGGDWIWLMRWQGTSPKAMLDPAEFPTVAALRVRWTEIEREQAAFVSNVTDESLRQEIHYTNLRGESYAYPLWQMMQHIANHSTFHRGQVVTLLRQLGAVPPATDLLVFHDVK